MENDNKLGGKKDREDQLGNLINPKYSDKQVYNKLLDKYNVNDDKVEKIFHDLKKKRKIVKAAAKELKEKFYEKLKNKGISYNEMVGKSVKAFNKIKDKYKLPSEALDFYMDLIFNDHALSKGIDFKSSKMGKFLGYNDLLKAGKLHVDPKDEKYIAEIQKLYVETFPLYKKVIVNSSTDTVDNVDAFVARVEDKTKYINKYHDKAEFEKNIPKNYYNHIHPVLFALFAIDMKDLQFMYQSNFGSIISDLKNGNIIKTQPDFQLYKNIVMDTSGLYSSQNPIIDFLNRYKLQISLWNELNCLRDGKLYDNNLNTFLKALTDFKENPYENPMYSFLEDNASIVRKIYGAFSYKPIKIVISHVDLNDQYVDNFSINNNLKIIGVDNVEKVSMINVKIKKDKINLNSTLIGSHNLYVKNNMLIKVNQKFESVNENSYLIINTDRKYYNPQSLNIFTYGDVPLTNLNWESIVDTEVDPVIKDYKLQASVIYIVNKDAKTNNLYIVGSMTNIIKTTNTDEYVYHPLGPISKTYVNKQDKTDITIMDFSVEKDDFRRMPLVKASLTKVLYLGTVPLTNNVNPTTDPKPASIHHRTKTYSSLLFFVKYP